jgi:hypothetical protein
MIVTCLLLGISGGIRLWRDWQFWARDKASATSPFPLKDLPENLGTWKMIKGSQTGLDPETARIAGSSDHEVREYMDEKGGEHASVMVLYGLAKKVFGHSPEACYPVHGYRLVSQVDRELTIPGQAIPVRYRAAIYAKKVGLSDRYEVVYHVFGHNSLWLPELADRYKLFRYHPGAYRILLQRMASTRLDLEDSAAEGLLGELVQEINRRTAPKGAGAPVAAATTAAATPPGKSG